jgi:hypothetical protein
VEVNELLSRVPDIWNSGAGWKLRGTGGEWLLPEAEHLLCRMMALELSVPAQVCILRAQPPLRISDAMYRTHLKGRLRHFTLGLRCLRSDEPVGVAAAGARADSALVELQSLRTTALSDSRAVDPFC